MLDAQVTEIIGFGGVHVWRGDRGRFITPDHVVRALEPSARRKLKRHRDASLSIDVTEGNLAERFYRFIDEPAEHGCQRWLGNLDRRGYGILRIGKKARKAHRISWALCNPGAEMPQVVMHTCDNRWCVAPAHLVGGTQGDNLRDASAKGRMFVPRGKKLISDDDVVTIRRMRREGATLDVIATRFNCSWTHVSNICAGRKRARVVEVVMPNGDVRAAIGIAKSIS